MATNSARATRRSSKSKGARGKSPKEPKTPRAYGRLFRWVAFGLLGVLLFPSLLLVAYRWVGPPMTPLMVIRRLEGYGIDRRWVPLEEIAADLRFAVIAAEDNRFCVHWGFDWQELRGQMDRLLAGGRPRGASTITMQTAKNVLLWDDRSFLRKVIEAWFTPQIELLWPKRRILEIYLNIVEFGPGTYGAEAAAQTFFNKPSSALSRNEAARLAAVLPAPLQRSAAEPSAAVNQHARVIARRIDQLGPLLACAR